MLLVEQELPTLPEHLSSLLVFSGVRVGMFKLLIWPFSANQIAYSMQSSLVTHSWSRNRHFYWIVDKITRMPSASGIPQISHTRDRPFNFQGEGGLWFFSKKIFWFPMLLKKHSDFGGGKKKSDSEFLSYNLMLNSGKKLRQKK